MKSAPVRPARRLVLVPLLLLLAAGPLSGARAQQGTDGEVAAVLEGLEFREIGPAVMGGRIADLAVVSADEFYAAAATGNLWYTRNRGTTWESLFDQEEVNSIGDVTLAPSDPEVIWIGTGEANNRQSSPWGAGVYRSTDGGASWRHLGLTETRHIGRIVVHPDDPDTAWVAAAGNLWAASPDRGVYKTTDGGESWEHVLFVNEDTGAIDIAIAPDNPDVLLAGMYQRRRTTCCFVGSGPGSGIYRSADGGDSWTEVTEGLPEGDKGRIGLDFWQGDGRRVWAIVQARGDASGIYYSEDRGRTWEQISDTNPRPMYYSQIRVDPQDPSRVYVLGAQLFLSDDGGRTFRRDGAPAVHLDHHAMWIDPDNSNHVLMAGDGGVSVSFDRSRTWRFIDNLPIGQFYEIGVSRDFPYKVYGGLQDNGSWGGPSRTLDVRGIRNADWFNVNGGDGFYTRVDPDDPSIVFAESQNGGLTRIDLDTMESQSIRPVARPDRATVSVRGRMGAEEPTEEEGEEGEESEDDDEDDYRWNWNTPILISQHDNATIYAGSNYLLRSRDRGLTWEEVSPDLTRTIDRDATPIMGITPSESLSSNDGVSTYGNITTLAESPLDPDVLFAGTDDGNLQRTVDGGANWTDLTETLPDLPDGAMASRVVPSSSVEGRVYATFDHHQEGDFRPFVYVSDDQGDTWRSITDGLPDWSVNVIVEHPEQPELLFLGNELGVWVSWNGGDAWYELEGNLPTVPVDDLVIHPDTNDLVVGTHGRSIWILDDLSPLQHLTSVAGADEPYLFPVADGVQLLMNSPQGWVGDAEFRADNPPPGATVRYLVPEGFVAPDTDDDSDQAEEGSEAESNEGAEESEPKVLLEVLDSEGRVIRTEEAPGTPGLHQQSWDLRHDSPVEPEEGEQQGGFFGTPPGPLVMPGEYTVRLTMGDAVVERPVSVSLDPRVEIGPEAMRARREVLERIQEFIVPYTHANRAVGKLQDVATEARRAIRGAEVSEELETMVGELERRVRAVAGDLRDHRRTLFAAFSIERSSAPPTEDQIWSVDQARNQLPGLIEQINEMITETVPGLYRQMNEENVRPDPGEPLEVPDWQ